VKPSAETVRVAEESAHIKVTAGSLALAFNLMTEAEHAYLGVYRPNEGPDPAETKLFAPSTRLAQRCALYYSLADVIG
jgi:hypothetical protein